MAFAGDFVEPTPEPQTLAHPAVAFVDRVGTARLLVLLAAACAIVLGTLAFILQIVDNVAIPSGGFLSTQSAIFALIVALLFGFLLLVAFANMQSKPSEGAVLALAFSIVLLVFGGVAGTIAGLLGLVGSLVAILRGMKLVA